MVVTAQPSGLSLKKRTRIQRIVLYMINALDLLQACLYEEKRDRQVLNIPLLMTVLEDYDAADEQSINNTALLEKGIFCSFVVAQPRDNDLRTKLELLSVHFINCKSAFT